MKKLLVILGLVMVSTLSFGQKNTVVNYSVGVQTLVGTDNNDVSNGVSLGVECKPQGKFSYTFNVMGNGLLNPKTVPHVEFPVMLGTKYYVNDHVSFGVGAGVTFNQMRIPTPPLTQNVSTANFVWSPSVTLSNKCFGVSALMISNLRNSKLTSQVGVGVSCKL